MYPCLIFPFCRPLAEEIRGRKVRELRGHRLGEGRRRVVRAAPGAAERKGRMKKFIPKDKLGKKARRELDRRQRVTWGFSPVTRTKESKKIYSRKRKSRDARYEGLAGLSFFCRALIPADWPGLAEPFLPPPVLSLWPPNRALALVRGRLPVVQGGWGMVYLSGVRAPVGRRSQRHPGEAGGHMYPLMKGG